MLQAAQKRLHSEFAKKAPKLRALQKLMCKAVMRPLTDNWDTDPIWNGGRKTEKIAAKFIKPNDRLSSFDRLEIYNKQYWFRIIDSFYDDFPGVRAVLGENKFSVLAKAYLTKYPSRSYSLRDLGDHFVSFIKENPRLAGSKVKLVLNTARLEWAKIIAFDSEEKKPLSLDKIKNLDPSKLRLLIQPYITPLALSYPVDEFILLLKKNESLKTEASSPQKKKTFKSSKVRFSIPKASQTYVVVHRVDNAVYYKRIDKEAYVLLKALEEGNTLHTACSKAYATATKKRQKNENWPETFQRWFTTWSALKWFCA